MVFFREPCTYRIISYVRAKLACALKLMLMRDDGVSCVTCEMHYSHRGIKNRSEALTAFSSPNGNFVISNFAPFRVLPCVLCTDGRRQTNTPSLPGLVGDSPGSHAPSSHSPANSSGDDKLPRPLPRQPPISFSRHHRQPKTTSQ